MVQGWWTRQLLQPMNFFFSLFFFDVIFPNVARDFLTNLAEMKERQNFQTGKKTIFTVLETGISGHNRGPMKGPLQYDSVVMFREISGGHSLSTEWCQETPVSRTAIRLIGVVFSTLVNFILRHGILYPPMLLNYLQGKCATETHTEKKEQPVFFIFYNDLRDSNPDEDHCHIKNV